jgi:alpha-L-rhamnosidase
MTVDTLLCERYANPLGVDIAQPGLSWIPQSAERGARQTAYEILVASSESLLSKDAGDLWDSGKVTSDETLQIHYAGKQLQSSQQVFWKLRVWDETGNTSPWSTAANWTMGVLESTDWHAQWIGAGDPTIPSLLLRHEFTVKPGLKRALAEICGLGQYALTLNGAKAGDDLLSPGWTRYDQTCLYDTRDITPLLHPGQNAAGIELADGMYRILATRFKPPAWVPYAFGPQQAIAQIHLEYADGSVDDIGTDVTWRGAAGPITASSIYSGEDFDARLIQHGWDTSGFDDSKWFAAKITSGPGGKLRGLSCAAPPIKLLEVQPPISSRIIGKGDVLYDLGQNAAHVPRISIDGPAGSRVRIIPSELGDGLVSYGSMGEKRRSVVWCDYTKATNNTETWTPAFFYVGCRYLEVQSFAAAGGTVLPTVNSIQGIVVQSSSEPAGTFECSSDLFNRIHTLVRWAQRSNMMSIMTDCPQREKRGWLEEDHLNGLALRYEFDLSQLFVKATNDMADSQIANGMVPTTAPEYALFGAKKYTDSQRNNFGDSPEWGSAFILVPWQQYEFDGDLDLLRSHYDAMKRYVTYLGGRANDNILSYGLGDWYDIGPKRPGIAQLTPIPLTATAFYFQDVKTLARVAALLGHPADTREYSDLAGHIRTAFNQKFYDPAHHYYATGSQTADSIPLVMDLCDPVNRPAVLDAIVADVRSHGNALTAGDIGYRYLLRALADGGRSDVIFDLNNQSVKPGYGYQLKMGATSLTEAWDARPSASQNHFMLGQINEWFYHDLAGIRPDDSAPAFKKIIIEPALIDGITWTKASYRSARGPISTEWRRAANGIELTVTIPANTTATVYLPAKSANDIGEGGVPATKAPGVQFLRIENGNALFEIGSGTYRFDARSS